MQGNNPLQGGGQQSSNTNKPAGLSWSQPQSAKPVSAFTSPASKPTATTTPKSIPAPTSSNAGKFIALFVAGAIVGGVLTWGWYTLQPAPTTTAQNTPTNTTGTNNTPTLPTGTIGGTNTTPVGTVGSSDNLSVAAEQNAGLAVAITSAPVTEPTWVVVYETTANGERGNALGAALFFPETKSRNINLLRPTLAGKTYLVGKRVDNGDKDFSMTLDKPTLNAAGQPLYVQFKAR